MKNNPFPYPLAETVEMQMRLLIGGESFAEAARAFGISENEVKKRTRILRGEIWRHCRMTEDGPAIAHPAFRRQMTAAMETLRRRDPEMWDFLYGSTAEALRTLLRHLEFMYTENLGYEMEDVIGGR